MSSVPTISTSVEARDVNCCTGCCPIFRRKSRRDAAYVISGRQIRHMEIDFRSPKVEEPTNLEKTCAKISSAAAGAEKTGK